MIGWISELVANPVFAGVAGGAVTTAVIYQVRAMPLTAWRWVHKRLSVTLVIDSNEELFQRLSVYLAASPFIHRARWLRMVEYYDYAEQRWRWKASFGLGWHTFRDQGAWFLMFREIEDEGKGQSARRRETITLRTLGPSQRAIRGIMERAEAVYETAQSMRVYVWHQGGYILADQKPHRTMASVYIPQDQKDRLVGDLQRYLGARDRYRRRGTPWRRGYLLEGPPGTGKTTLAFVMASLANRPVYLINLNTAGGDTGLVAAFNMAEPGAVVVIEDIDTAKVSHSRDAVEAAPTVSLAPEESVTLGGLLNAIDGLGSRDNRILIVTSNHADRLDKALLRPGRIDHRETIGLIAEAEARAMTAAFLGEGSSSWFDAAVQPRLPMSPAELQGLLLVESEGGSTVVPFAAPAAERAVVA